MINLKALSTPPEEYAIDIIQELPQKAIEKSLMSDSERRFVNGLIRMQKPTRILEIGVSSGGGTCVILNAIKDMPDAKLISIDLHPGNYIGSIAKELYGENANGQWQLHKGKDPVEVLDSIDEQYDFCVIDSGHLHPVESLNFLTALPFLKEGCIVVMHDIRTYRNHFSELPLYYAPRILLHSVTGPKLQPKASLPFAETNIGSFQVTKDTKRDISNLFSALHYPWETITGNKKEFVAFFEKHYSKEAAIAYQSALNFAVAFFEKKIRRMLSNLNQTETIILYGAGRNCRRLLHYVTNTEFAPLKDSFVIWDVNADNIGSVNGIPVQRPEFETLSNSEHSVIITQAGADVVRQVIVNMHEVGFNNYEIFNLRHTF